MSGGHGHIEGSNKKIALLVAVLAALLAISEMGGKSSQTNALASHIDGSNLWNFFQAKTIRQTTMRTAAEEAEATFKDSPQGMPAAMKAQTERWRQTAQRYETEPETGEGRKELMARAKIKEEHRDRSLAAYHMFEYASAAFQLAIVLAGAAALTSVMWLTVVSVGLGVVGFAFTLLAFLAPTLVHL
jgi:ABC-type multidrug transport system fused ATPase/permease subunit